MKKLYILKNYYFEIKNKNSEKFMVDKLVEKFKKIVHEEKKRHRLYDKNDDDEEEEEENEINNLKISKKRKIKNEEEDDNDNRNKFNETQKNTFTSSDLLTRSERNQNKHFTKSFSESQMKKSPNFGRRSSSSKSKEKNKLSSKFSESKRSSLDQNDKIVNIISKTISYIEKQKENISLSKIVDNLNEILDLHIASLSDMRVASTQLGEKEIIMQTKYETAEKMAKNFELKYLTSEKEKSKLNKQLDEISSRFNQLKEKYEMHLQQNEEMGRLEKNNQTLLLNNDDLKKQISEMNVRNDFVKKKYEEEISEIKNLLNLYKEKLEIIENRIYNKQININKNNNNNFEDKTITLNTIQ